MSLSVKVWKAREDRESEWEGGLEREIEEELRVVWMGKKSYEKSPEEP